MVHERVWFRLIQLPCCGHLFCNVNPRLPSYCPMCGKLVIGTLKTQGEHIKISDPDATLSFNEKAQP